MATPPTPSALPSASPEPRWLLVTISDSTLGIGQGDVAAADVYADRIEHDLGVAVTVRSFFYGGSTSGQILSEVRTSTSLRDAIANADGILLDVPLGELKELCPWDDVSYAPGPGTPAEYAACGAEMAMRYEADAGAIMDEIVALRSPAEALIRTTELWKPFYPTFESLGLGPATHQNFLAIWAGLGRAAPLTRSRWHPPTRRSWDRTERRTRSRPARSVPTSFTSRCGEPQSWPSCFASSATTGLGGEPRPPSDRAAPRASRRAHRDRSPCQILIGWRRGAAPRMPLGHRWPNWQASEGRKTAI
jgi:hypothetical protein